MSNSRQVALDVLIAWDREGSYPNILLKEKLGLLSDVRERSFCTSLVYGVIETKIKLDYLISKVSSVPFKKIHIVNRNTLRIGLYQILFMNVPVSAACNTAVNLAKKNGQAKSSGFVNAVLRKLASQENKFSFSDENDVSALSVRYSVDPSIINLILKQCDVSFVREYFEALEKLPPNETTIAVNLIKTNADALANELSKQGVEILDKSDELLTVKFTLDISLLSSYREGHFHVIGRPSFETVRKLDVRPGQTVIDLCSAPGGKTFALAYKMKNQGRIIAADISPAKIDVMEQEAKRLGITNIDFLCADGTKCVLNWDSCADRVLCDVPCSGLGIIRKKPDIRYKDLTNFSLMDTQRRILENGLSYLKNGGRLVYSTCTVNPAENCDVVSSFNDKLIEQKTFLPQTDGTEGFYYALLEK